MGQCLLSTRKAFHKPDIANLIERITALEEKVQVLEGYHTTTDVPEGPVV